MSWHFVMNLFLITALLYGFLEINWYIIPWVSFIRCSFKSKLCMLLQNVCTSRPDRLEQSNQIELLQALCCEGSNQSKKRAKSPTKPFPSLTFPLTGRFSLSITLAGSLSGFIFQQPACHRPCFPRDNVSVRQRSLSIHVTFSFNPFLDFCARPLQSVPVATGVL